jgi:translocation and assembly module TamA
MNASAQPTVIVEIEGLEPTLETNVRLYLSIEQQKDNPLVSDGRLRRLHQKANKEINTALQPYGYYRPQIEASLIREDGDNWRAIYRIDPGPALPIGSFDFTISSEMGSDPEFLALLETQTLRPGSVFSHLEYERFKTALSRLASERGYFAAEFTRQRVEIDLDTYTARIYLDYDGGPRYRFGDLSISQDVIEDELLRRYSTFQRGDPYSLEQLLQFQQALNNSRYFQTVEISPGEVDAETREVGIQVNLSPRNRHVYKLGAGYGTDTDARASFGWEMPRINRKGHRLDTELKVSGIGYSVETDYIIPVLDPRTDRLVFSVSEVEEEFESDTSTRRILGVSLNHGRGQWRETLSLDYQREEYSLADEDENSTLLIPGVSWSRTWGRDFINVLDGVRFDIALAGGSESLVSDTDFSKLGASLKFITSLSPRDRIIMRGGIGSINTNEFNKIPPSLRFYAGGATSVRGYAYQSLGPENADGEAIGAENLLVGSAEYEHYFNDRWGMALFYDIGNAVEDFSDDLESGAGFGLRWKSPIGPVRVDLASAISDDEDWRLHINIGPDL